MDQPQSRLPNRVVITNFDMPFMSLVGFLVKLAFASIPATIIVSVVWVILFFIFTAILAGCGLALGGY